MTGLLLFTGKGGVGKTTLAAATAAGLAARGHKTLVVSTDPAHSLGDALDRHLSAEPAEVDHGLYGAQVDSRGLVDAIWQDLRGKLRSALSAAGLDVLEAEELTVLPGVDELLALTEVQRLAETGRWHTVVVDCGPTAETLRLLALPEAVSGYLDKMFGWPGRFAGRGTAQAVRGLAAHLASLRSLLTDPETTGVRLVLTPERVVVAEARRTLSALALRGIRVDGLIVNRLMPVARGWRGVAASWLRARRGQQDMVLAELAASGFAGFARVEHRAIEPVGLPALLEIAEELYGDGDPLLGAGGDQASPLLELSEVDGGYRLRVSLPLGRDTGVELARVDDDLSITVDGFRRLVALPERLRAYRVTGAESGPGGLVVSFAAMGKP